MTAPHEDFAAFDPTQPQQPPRNSWLPACLVGCLALFVVAICVCGGISWYAWRNFKTLATNVARGAIETIVSESELEAEEKQAIMTEVDRVIDQYKAGKISTEDLGHIMQELAESPLMGVIMVSSIEAKYVVPSGLSEEESRRARRTLQRLLRGIQEESITREQLETAMDQVTTETQEGGRQLKDSVSDQELRDFLTESKRLADQASVPDESFQMKISDEFRRAIDRALSED